MSDSLEIGLKEFVRDTLIQITEGIKEAQDECFKIGGLIPWV